MKDRQTETDRQRQRETQRETELEIELELENFILQYIFTQLHVYRGPYIFTHLYGHGNRWTANLVFT